jgi:aquaporin Z
MYNYLVEFIATLFFMYVILATGNPLAIGAALALIILVAGKLSGGHVNPAVSIAMVSAGKLNVNDLVPYIVAQILGALTALQVYKRVQV